MANAEGYTRYMPIQEETLSIYIFMDFQDVLTRLFDIGPALSSFPFQGFGAVIRKSFNFCPPIIAPLHV